MIDKKYIGMFLKGKKRGVYRLIVETYADTIKSIPITMALEMIAKDLEKNCGEKVSLNYFSLAQAALKFKKKVEAKPRSFPKRQFLDAHEEPDNQLGPGRFKD